MIDLQYFDYKHLPDYLQSISKPFYDLAHNTIYKLPDCNQRDIALQNLLASKDAAVRSAIKKY